jgi:hypothetical protein
MNIYIRDDFLGAANKKVKVHGFKTAGGVIKSKILNNYLIKLMFNSTS